MNSKNSQLTSRGNVSNTFLNICQKDLDSEADESSILREVGDRGGKLEVGGEKLAGSWKQQLVALPVIILYYYPLLFIHHPILGKVPTKKAL